jgi:hypothetical protein
MRFRLLLALGATLALAACSESTAPKPMRPDTRSNDVIECRSGYHVATRADGTEYCEADDATLPPP